MRATETLVEASEQAYSSFVSISLKAQLTTELKQKLLNACPQDTPYEVLHKGKYLCKNLEVKEGGENLVKEGVFSGTYSTSLVPRPYSLTSQVNFFVFNAEEANTMPCKLATTRKVLNSHQTIFLMRGSDLDTRLL